MLISVYTFGCEALLYIPYSMIAYFGLKSGCHPYTVIMITVPLTFFILTCTNIYEQVARSVNFNVTTLAMITFIKQDILVKNFYDGKCP